MSAMASQIIGISIVYSTVCSGADQRKHQSPASLACVGDVNSPHKWPVTRKGSTFDDVIMVNVKMLTHNAAGIAMTFPSSIPVLEHCLTMAYTVRTLFCTRTQESLNVHVDIYTDPNSGEKTPINSCNFYIIDQSTGSGVPMDATQSNITRYHICHSSKGTKRSWLIYQTFKS